MIYKLKDEYSELPPSKLITQMVGEAAPFTLSAKPYELKIPASKAGPEQIITAKPATQAQLKKLHELGSTLIEAVPAKKGNS